MTPFAEETKVPLQAAIRAHPDTRHVGQDTARRWCRVGCRRRGDRAVVKLEYRMVGAMFFTSTDAIDRFLAAINSPAHAA